jgi:hypothetical protein
MYTYIYILYKYIFFSLIEQMNRSEIVDIFSVDNEQMSPGCVHTTIQL